MITLDFSVASEAIIEACESAIASYGKLGMLIKWIIA